MSQKGHVFLVVVLMVAVLIGFFLYQKQNKPNIVLNVQPSPSPSIDETDNWNIYSNLDWGYSFKYPKDYVPYYPDGNVFHGADAKFDKVTTAKTSGVEIGSLLYGPGEDKEDYKGPNTQIDSYLVSKLTLPEGYTAKVYKNLEDITVAVDFKKDNKDMRIMLWCGGENGDTQSCEEILNSLLPTFKILDQSKDDSNWETYKNSEYGFEFKHPGNSIIESRTAGGIYPYQYIRIQNYTEEEVIKNKGKLVAGQYYIEISIHDHQLGHKGATVCKEEAELKEISLGELIVYRGIIDAGGGDSSGVGDGICVNKLDLDLYIQASEAYGILSKKIIDSFKFTQ